jgi:phosphatidylglycerophosphate synthase
VSRTEARPWQPLATGAVVEGAGLAAAGGAGLLMPLPALGAAVGYLGGSAIILSCCRQPGFGLANLVTLGRVVGTCWVIGLTLQALFGRLGETGLTLMIIIGSCCLVLDGVDGTVARARGETSPFGARFDVETDAVLLLTLSTAVPVLGVAGWWVLALGLTRYAYVIASWIGPRRVRAALRIPLPYRYSAKVVAVVQVIALLTVLTMDLTGAATIAPAVPSLLLVGALAALWWSFGHDVVWQLRAASC